MKTIEIKGKAYVEVHERIKYFRENFENGKIKTDILELEDGVCVMKASVYIGSDLVATGHAYEKESSSFINKTSYIENCETSAVGRALGIFGIGIDASVASVEEVTNAINNQKKKATKDQINNIEDLLSVVTIDRSKFKEFFGCSYQDASYEVAEKMIYELEKKYAKEQAESEEK